MGAEIPAKRPATARAIAEAKGCSERLVRLRMAQPRAEYLAEAREREDAVYTMRMDLVPYETVADTLGITVVAARSLFARAKRRRRVVT